MKNDKIIVALNTIQLDNETDERLLKAILKKQHKIEKKELFILSIVSCITQILMLILTAFILVKLLYFNIFLTIVIVIAISITITVLILSIITIYLIKENKTTQKI